jgi:Cu-Zn family superoxide dismutase
VRRIIQVAAAAAVLVCASSGVALAHHGHGKQSASERLFTLQPDPAGNPEGVAADKKAFYVSSTGDGAIYRGTLDSPTVTPFIAGGTGRSAVGLKVDRGKLYVAGGSTGSITVYDLASKQAVATFQTGSGGFLNDLVVTGRGDVYVTDSLRPTLWHVTRDQVRAGSGTPQALDVSGGIPYQTGFNVNGIVAKSNKKLVVVQSNTGKLFRIKLENHGTAIDEINEITGVSVPGGDGMLLDDGKLIVVQGGPPAQLSFIKLHDGAPSGELKSTRTSTLLKGPSTIARAKDTYLVVNADFATSTKPFTVAGLPRNDKGDNHDHGDDDHHGHDHGDDHHGHGHDHDD